MNAAVTVGLGPDKAVVLIGPDVPIGDQLRAVKRRQVEVPPGVDQVEVWSRNSGTIRRRRIKTAAEPDVPQARAGGDSSEDSPTAATDEDSPVAEATPKKRTARKKET